MHKLQESGQGGGRLEGILKNSTNDGVDLVPEFTKPDLASIICN